MSKSSSSDPTLGIAYWVIVLSLFLLGLVSLFSIGRAFWLLAAAMLVLGPFRSRPRVWWSGMALVTGFLLAYAAVAPWGCTSTESFDPVTGVAAEGVTVCRSLTGVEYVGLEGFEPSGVPGIVAGVVVGVVAAMFVWHRLSRPETPAAVDRVGGL